MKSFGMFPGLEKKANKLGWALVSCTSSNGKAERLSFVGDMKNLDKLTTAVKDAFDTFTVTAESVYLNYSEEPVWLPAGKWLAAPSVEEHIKMIAQNRRPVQYAIHLVIHYKAHPISTKIEEKL